MSKALDNAEDGERYRAPALDKGLDILELLAEHPDGLTRAEIVRNWAGAPVRSTACSSGWWPGNM